MELGHRCVAVVTRLFDHNGPADLATPADAAYTTQQRMAGWFDALEPAGITPVVVNAEETFEAAGYEASSTFLGIPAVQRPAAVPGSSERRTLQRTDRRRLPAELVVCASTTWVSGH